MSADRGIIHSEFNASQTELVHLLQIWVLPEQAGLVPSYEQDNNRPFSGTRKFLSDSLPPGRSGVVKLHQDATVSVGVLKRGQRLRLSLFTESMHDCGWLAAPLH